jgi:hypothetical protein
VLNFSFLIIGSAGAAGRHDFDPKMTFVVLAGASGTGVPRMRALTARDLSLWSKENTMKRRIILSVSAKIALGLALFGTTAGSTARAAEIKLSMRSGLATGNGRADPGL